MTERDRRIEYDAQAASAFEQLVSTIGAQTIRQVFDFAEGEQAEGKSGAVAFPENEHEYAIAVHDDGLVHFQIGRHERFNIPVDRARELTDEALLREAAPNN